jgi:hypothetical protein
MLQQAFGKDVVKKGVPSSVRHSENQAVVSLGDNTFEVVTSGVAANTKPYIGTLWHIIDQPEAYTLNPLQRRAVEVWRNIFNAERDFSAGVGVEIGKVEGTWIAHRFRNPDTATEIFTSSSMKKKRRLTTDDFLKVAAEHNLVVRNGPPPF